MARHQPTGNYVYFHELHNGSVFYVGMGATDRAWETDSRNQYWKNVVKKHGGYHVRIVRDGLTLDEARDLERFYISYFGRRKYESDGILVNLAEGGQGNKGFRKTYLFHPVTAFNDKGEIVGRWNCIEDVVNDGYSCEMVRQCVKYRKKSHKELIWVRSELEQCKALIACLIASAKNLKRYPIEFRERMKVHTTRNYNEGKLPHIQLRKRVYVYDRSGNKLCEFDSTSDAARHYGLRASMIAAVSRGEKKTYKNKIFRYEPWEAGRNQM
jgi:hypothetical protein